MLRSLEEDKAFWIKIPLTTHSLFDTIYQVNSIFHEGVVSAKVWFVNILIVVQSTIWQILNNETHVYLCFGIRSLIRGEDIHESFFRRQRVDVVSVPTSRVL